MINPNRKLNLHKSNMNLLCLLFTIVGLGILAPGPGVAGEPSGQTSGQGVSRDHVASDPHAGQVHGNQTSARKTTAQRRPGPNLAQPFQSIGGPPGVKRPNNAQTKTTPADAAVLHRPGLDKFTRAANDSSRINQFENHRGLPATGLAPPPLNQVVPRPGPSPAKLGGPAMSNVKNSAVINGTGMQHRP